MGPMAEVLALTDDDDEPLGMLGWDKNGRRTDKRRPLVLWRDMRWLPAHTLAEMRPPPTAHTHGALGDGVDSDSTLPFRNVQHRIAAGAAAAARYAATRAEQAAMGQHDLDAGGGACIQEPTFNTTTGEVSYVVHCSYGRAGALVEPRHCASLSVQLGPEAAERRERRSGRIARRAAVAARKRAEGANGGATDGSAVGASGSDADVPSGGPRQCGFGYGTPGVEDTDEGDVDDAPPRVDETFENVTEFKPFVLSRSNRGLCAGTTSGGESSAPLFAVHVPSPRVAMRNASKRIRAHRRMRAVDGGTEKEDEDDGHDDGDDEAGPVTVAPPRSGGEGDAPPPQLRMPMAKSPCGGNTRGALRRCRTGGGGGVGNRFCEYAKEAHDVDDVTARAVFGDHARWLRTIRAPTAAESRGVYGLSVLSTPDCVLHVLSVRNETVDEHQAYGIDELIAEVRTGRRWRD